MKRHKLTLEEKEQVIKLYTTTDLLQKDIAEKLKISASSVCNILKSNNISIKSLIKCDETFFETINSIERAWVSGFILADGCLHGNDSYTIRIALTSKDVEVLEKIKKYMKLDHSIKKVNTVNKTVNKIYSSIELNIARKKLWEDLVKLGIGPNKSKELTLPNIPKYLMRDFIRGVHCGDGGFYIDRDNRLNWSLACPVLSFLEEIQQILFEECNLEKKTITSTPNKKCYKLVYGGNNVVRKIFNYLYPDPEHKIFLERKYNYARNHFDNLDKGIKSRNEKEVALNQYEFSKEPQPKPRNQLDILLGINK